MSRAKQTREKLSKTFRIDGETVRAIERIALEENRTVNNMVETVLKEEVKKRALQLA